MTLSVVAIVIKTTREETRIDCRLRIRARGQNEEPRLGATGAGFVILNCLRELCRRTPSGCISDALIRSGFLSADWSAHCTRCMPSEKSVASVLRKPVSNESVREAMQSETRGKPRLMAAQNSIIAALALSTPRSVGSIIKAFSPPRQLRLQSRLLSCGLHQQTAVPPIHVHASVVAIIRTRLDTHSSRH